MSSYFPSTEPAWFHICGHSSVFGEEVFDAGQEGWWREMGEEQIFPDLATGFFKQSSLLIRRLSRKAVFEEEQG